MYNSTNYKIIIIILFVNIIISKNFWILEFYVIQLNNNLKEFDYFYALKLTIKKKELINK